MFLTEAFIHAGTQFTLLKFGNGAVARRRMCNRADTPRRLCMEAK